MTDYDKLAQRIVAFVVGRYLGEHIEQCYQIGNDMLDAEDFCNDWRVVGALIQKIHNIGSIKYIGHDTSDVTLCTVHVGWGSRKNIYHAVNESCAIAIAEACCDALEVRDE